MKKLFFIAIAISVFTLKAVSQNPDLKPSKQQKAQIKAEQDSLLDATLKAIDLTNDQADQVKQTLKDATKKSSDLKKADTLTMEQKAAQKDAITAEKNSKLKQIMGADKYRQWNAIRKQQKEQTQTSFDPNF